MTFFRFDIGSRAKAIGRFVGHVRDEFARAVSEETAARGVHGNGLAHKLGIPRSTLDGQLSGRKAFTLRGLADLAHALDREIVFELRRPNQKPGQNIRAETTTIDTVQVFQFGQSVRSSTTMVQPEARTIGKNTTERAS